MIRQVRCLRSSSAPTSSAAEGGDGQNWLGGDGATVACGADVSLQCAFEQRHRRKTLRLTGMELFAPAFARSSSARSSSAVHGCDGAGQPLRLRRTSGWARAGRSI
ncbi:hypothetical protein VPH35_075472 [Triticum aestivum]